VKNALLSMFAMFRRHHNVTAQRCLALHIYCAAPRGALS
jgi:hypothetical protein